MGILDADAGSCLDYDAAQLGESAKVVVVVLPVLVILIILALFMWWQIGSINSEEEALQPVLLPHPGAPFDQKVTCLGCDLIPANAALPCRCISLPCITKPEELLGTYIWSNLIFTWPYQPREGDPPMPITSRKTIALISIMFQLLLMNMLGTFMGELIGDKVPTVTPPTVTTTNATPAAQITSADDTLSFGDSLLNIIIVIAIDALLIMLLTKLYGISHEKGKGVKIGIAVGVGAIFLVVAVFITISLQSLSCDGFVLNVVVPFLSKTPLGVAMSPIFYILVNTFGKGEHIVMPLDEVLYPVDERGCRISTPDSEDPDMERERPRPETFEGENDDK